MYGNNSTTGNDTVQRAQHQSTGDYTTHMFRLVSELGLSFPIAILGIFGNLIALIVLSRHKHRQTTNVLLQILAVADTLVLITTILLRSSRYLFDGFDRTLRYHYIYRWMYPTTFSFRLIDTWLTVLLTIDRYIAVCHPLSASRLCTLKRTYISVAAIVLLSFVFCAPRYLEVTLALALPPGMDEPRLYLAFTSLLKNRPYNIGYRLIVYFMVMYLVPMALLIALNTALLLALKKASKERAALCLSHRQNVPSSNVNRSVSIIVVTVVVFAIVCNTSAMVGHILWSVGYAYPQYRLTLDLSKRYISNISNVLITLNSAINFVIYCLWSRNFRTVLKHTCISENMCARPSPQREAAALMNRGNFSWNSSTSNYTQSFRLSGRTGEANGSLKLARHKNIVNC